MICISHVCDMYTYVCEYDLCMYICIYVQWRFTHMWCVYVTMQKGFFATNRARKYLLV